MKLRKAVVDNYRALRHLDLSFEDDLGRIRPLTVIAGPNGCGKTSLLFAIVQALRGPMGYRTDDVPQPDELDIYQRGSYELSPVPPSISVKLELEVSQAEMTAIPEVLRDTAEAISDSSVEEITNAERLPTLPNGRLFVDWEYPPQRNPDGTRKPTWASKRIRPFGGTLWLQGRRRAIRGWIEHRLSSPQLIEQVGGVCLFPQDRSLRSRVLDKADDGAGSPSPGTENISGDVGRERNEPTVWDILDYLGRYAHSPREKTLTDDENWEKRIQTIFARICAPKKYLGFLYRGPTGAPFLDDQGSAYPLDRAASGEQIIMEYITRLTYPSPLNYSLILIDEAEIHLHPGWIRQLYRALPRIGVGNQYILTTHSTELRAMAAEDRVLVELGELEDQSA